MAQLPVCILIAYLTGYQSMVVQVFSGEDLCPKNVDELSSDFGFEFKFVIILLYHDLSFLLHNDKTLFHAGCGGE